MLVATKGLTYQAFKQMEFDDNDTSWYELWIRMMLLISAGHDHGLDFIRSGCCAMPGDFYRVVDITAIEK